MQRVPLVVSLIKDNGEGTILRLTWRNSKGETISYETAGGIRHCMDRLVESVGDNSLLVTRGPLELRCLIHPQAAREELRLDPLFMRYVDASLLSGRTFSDSQEEQLNELWELISLHSTERLAASTEHIKLGCDVGVCERSSRISDDVIVRARGLPWQATDTHVALFFAGLNIAPGGIALCLSVEGRRNGEALIRFESSSHRELALRRHRHFLLSRYIEVYRGTAEDFICIAAGSSSEAVDFVSKGAAMIVRMRGLPFDCTEDQIRQFFGEVNVSIVGEGGVLFVSRADGRPTGDAFVLFEKEEEALTRHRHTIGSRYVELFRSSQAEVQQVVKRSGDSVAIGTRRDSIRLRGLPYEARVEHVVEFLGIHSSQIVPQGVHMVFNAQGHPSGEAFIQMSSDGAAAALAASTHNKFMTIGKKQRYIEVFQCSPDEMNLMVAPPRSIPPSTTQPSLILPTVPPHSRLFPNIPMPFGLPHYWPYPSPPVSPNMLLNTGGQILVTGLAAHVTAADIVAHFSANSDTIVDSVEMVRYATPSTPGEALVRVRPRELSLPVSLTGCPPMSLQPPIPSIPSINTGLPFPLIHT